jgi:uncharacterized iron-regulated membrane protein
MQGKPAIWERPRTAIQAGVGFIVVALLVGLWVFFTHQTGSAPDQQAPPQAAAGQQPGGEPEAAKEQAKQQAEEAAAPSSRSRRQKRRPRRRSPNGRRKRRQRGDGRRRRKQPKRLAQQQAEEAAGPADIAELQRLLNVGTPDGKAGPRTQEMVRAFQLASGEPASGELAPRLLESLRRARPSADAKAKAVLSLAAGASR